MHYKYDSLAAAPLRTPRQAPRRRTLIGIALAAGAVLALSCCHSSASALSLRVPQTLSRRVGVNAAIGEKAPMFSLPSESGKKISLADFKGPFGIEQLSKPVVLFFYGGQGSPSCTKEAEAFARAYPEFKAKGAEVLGVSRDSLDFSKNWKEEKQFPFPLLSDEDGAVRESFGIEKDLFGLLDGRETYVIGRDGTIQMKFNSQFEPEKHIEKALAALE
uniref:thioredoxin-dependent peroxiredoxin n=1 Tax=Norrisiella sphaerica TaxID=552664 RepID=A0A7S2VU21_9EUKA